MDWKITNLSSIFSPNVTWRPVNWSAWRRLPDGRNLTELFVSPEEFIPLFESSGFITRFDMYIWKSVCKTLAAWQDKGCKLVPISINVSMIDITNIDVPQYLSMLTEQYHISPEYLPVEITESVFAESNTIVKILLPVSTKRVFTCSWTILAVDILL